MCSTFKLLLAAQALRWSELGRLSMDQRLDYPRSALVEYSPVTELRVDSGMTVRELCEATVTLSDNTAANVLLAKMDEPAGFTRFVRQLGDRHTRLDRYEPALNTAIPGDLRDTTTPLAMLASMESVCLGEGLADSSRQQLRQWLLDCKTGDATLRAGAPGWTVGNKTGGGHETRSDVGIFWPPGVVNRGKPVLVTAYLTECPAVPKDRDAALASVAREVVRILT